MAEPHPKLAVLDAIESHRDELLALDGVIGIGVGGTEDRPAVQIFHSGEVENATEVGARHLVGDVPVVFAAFSVPRADSQDV